MRPIEKEWHINEISYAAELATDLSLALDELIYFTALDSEKRLISAINVLACRDKLLEILNHKIIPDIQKELKRV